MTNVTPLSISEANGRLNLLGGDAGRRADARRLWRDLSGVGFDEWADMAAHLKDALGRDAVTFWLEQPEDDNRLNFEDAVGHIVYSVTTSLGDTPRIDRVRSYAQACWASDITAAGFEVAADESTHIVDVPEAEDIGDERQAVADAVEADHPMCDDAPCDVRAALHEAETPYVAASLLLGAAECPAIGALCDEYPEVGGKLGAGPHDLAEWTQWAEWFDQHKVECLDCGAFCLPVDGERPETCSNCLATLPPKAEAGRTLDAYERLALAVREDAAERVDWCRRNDESIDHPEDLAHEITDSMVPVYYSAYPPLIEARPELLTDTPEIEAADHWPGALRLVVGNLYATLYTIAGEALEVAIEEAELEVAS